MLKKIIKFCNENFSNEYKCSECSNTECEQSCKKCLENINFNKVPRRIIKGYDCLNITYFYCGKYGYKYSSEIEKLLLKNDDLFGSYDNYNVISIGCGPCTDLYGFLNYLNVKHSEKQIAYCGIDKNAIWSTIHDQIHIHKPENLKVRFIYDSIENIHFRHIPNIVVMQYLLSDMRSSGFDLNTIYQFLTNTIIVKMNPGDSIIINDINLGRIKNGPRDTYSDFTNIITQAGIKIDVRKSYFHNTIREKTYCYGEKHSNSNITMLIEDSIVEKFDPWQSCASAQMIIRKQ